MTRSFIFIILISVLSCNHKEEKIKPTIASITSSVYASGIVKSKNQYQVFPTVSGIISDVWITEGDTVAAGTALMAISSEMQRLSTENAALAAAYSDYNANQGKLNEAGQVTELAASKMKLDSSLYYRQLALWKQDIGTKAELEQRELAYKNSKTAYLSAVEKYNDLKRQLDFASAQSKKNLLISSKLQSDYTIKSEIDGIVYDLKITKGDIATPQIPVAVIGDADNFILEMQVDENDILRIRTGLTVLVMMDSYHDSVFEAVITRIIPLMNERSKTFLVEAAFKEDPGILYPNLTFEANIVVEKKEKAMLIPRNYLLNDSIAIRSNGEQVKVKTGIKDFRNIEILSGLHEDEELIKPAE
ncbi:MAG: efflux RND transporter periplasmic adaptor subunit [Chitinophagales bacterium]|nr:efflux RND transporter periplasmic adaptor subunit [Chitinophagales bacterium]